VLYLPSGEQCFLPFHFGVLTFYFYVLSLCTLLFLASGWRFDYKALGVFHVGEGLLISSMCGLGYLQLVS